MRMARLDNGVPWLIPALVGVLMSALTAAAEEPQSNGSKETTGKGAEEEKSFPPPKTLSEAFQILDRQLSYENRQAIKSSREDGLIRYHFGLGMWIRNNFGLWAGNESLYKDMGVKPKTHPDSASGVLLRAYWEYLNQDFKRPELDSVPPEQYFDKVLFYLRRAYTSKSERLVNSLPLWVFESRNPIGFGYAPPRDRLSKDEEKRQEQLLEVANSLLTKKNEASCLALLYLSDHRKDAGLITLLEGYLGVDTPTILYPLKVEDDPYFSAMLTSDDIEHQFELKAKWATSKDGKYPEGFLWRTLSAGDIALRALNQIYAKDFTSPKEYAVWKNARKTNPFLYWHCKPTFEQDDIKKLSSDKALLLKVLLLSPRLSHHDEHNSGLPTDIRTSIDGLSKLVPDVGKASEKEAEQVYPKRFRRFTGSSKDALALRHIMDGIDDKALFDSISLKALADYNLHHKTTDLNEYNRYVGFVLTAGRARLLKMKRNKELWNICEHYRQNDHLSWPFESYLIELLFEIDPVLTRGLTKNVLNPNNEPDSTYSFGRQGFLRAMIEKDFDNSEQLIEEWFWYVHDKFLDHHPNERDVILETLQKTSDKTRRLHQKLTSDPRFKKARQKTEAEAD